MELNFQFQALTGAYRGSYSNQLSDLAKLNAMLYSLALDMNNVEAAITALQSTSEGNVDVTKFVVNTLDGNVIKDNSISASKITDSSITGSKIITNSISGIKNENIASDAAIASSKLDLSGLSHTALENIGSYTHAQIDSLLNVLFTNTGVTQAPAWPSLTSRISGIDSTLTTLGAFVSIGSLKTTSQNVRGSLNELHDEIATISVSGYFSGEASTGTTAADFTIYEGYLGAPSYPSYLEFERGTSTNGRIGYPYDSETLRIYNADSSPIACEIIGDLDVNRNLEVVHNTILGTASGDTIAFDGSINSNIVPFHSGIYNIGSAPRPFNTIYAHSIVMQPSGISGSLDRAGTATILTGNANVCVNADVSPTTLAFITATGNNADDINLRTFNLLAGSGFVIGTKTGANVTSNLTVNWMVIN
jgi:hypothetical protein